MVVTDVETGGIDKGQSGRLPQIRMEEGTQRGQTGTDALDKTIVGRKEVRESRADDEAQEIADKNA